MNGLKNTFRKENFIQVSGSLYTAVQSSGIFKDSKTFVDSVPLHNPQSIMQQFEDEKSKKSFDLKKFVSDNFEIPRPEEISVKLPENRSMREHIKLLWDVLKRSPDKNTNSYSSLIPLPHPYIIPGGRFREVYYWDSYFTMHGLLADKEIETVENMIENFAYLIDSFGFIPNGNRVYYLTRSQPPFFAAMIDLVCSYKNDYEWGLNFLPRILKEYRFWCGDTEHYGETERLVFMQGGGFLNHYYDSEAAPREESYREDVETAEVINEAKRHALYKNIRAACESGWDFSSRWFEVQNALSSCVASRILPVDLNCLLYFYESLMAKLCKIKGDIRQAVIFERAAELRAELINRVFWNEKERFYFDYDNGTYKHTGVFSLAACYPLYFNIAEKDMAEGVKKIIETRFLKEGGLLSTDAFTGQQWDAPNGWAPLQWIAFKGLLNYGYEDLAHSIRKRWLTLNENVFKRTGKMFEKYNVDNLDLHAGGGEYPLQDGFGWTNGIAAAMLDHN